jgi:16S rRNA (guanine(966)-N(2))-methyltransferase RsmD
MRVSGGSARGRVIEAPKGVDLRPTEERVRQALFNIVGASLFDCEFLDLCCGTGAVGLEALSRGASKVIFADREPRCLKNVETYTAAFGFQSGTWELLRGEAEACLDQMAHAGRSFDMIYFDPPYESSLGESILRQLGGLTLLKPSGAARVIYEHASSTKAPSSHGSLILLRRYLYGNSALSFYGLNHAN